MRFAAVTGPRPLFVCCLAAVAFLTLASCGGQKLDHHDTVLRYLPAHIETTWKFPGEVRTAKVRVYADAEVRALPHWKEDISEEIDYASQLFQPLIGVSLSIESFKDWARAGTPEDALHELTQLDKADGVTWVVGYVAPPEASTRVMTALGSAQTLGHHVTVRGWSEKAETNALAGRLPDAKDPERPDVITAHHRHKQAVVLLHMLATTLGAIAETDPTWIQAASYSPQQQSFSNRNREILQYAANSRIGGEADVALAKRLADNIEQSNWGGWVPASHDEVLLALHNIVEASRKGSTFANVPSEAFDEFKRISDLAQRGKGADALIELDNLLTAYPSNGTMHELKCEIMLTKPGVADKATRTACDRVIEISPGDPTVHIAVAEALIRAGDLPAARTELAKAEDKIGNLATGAVDAWHRVIGIYSGMGALTWTEDAIGKAKLEGDPAAAKAAQTRARMGIPRGARFVAADQEAALVAATRKSLDLVYASKFGEASRALAAAEKKWPNAPGLTAVRCDLAFRQNQIEAARATCARALAADPNDSWALYLMGTLLLRDTGTTPTGVAKLKQAIAVDPDLGQAWRTLGRAYERDNNKAARAELDKAYQAKFGQALPP